MKQNQVSKYLPLFAAPGGMLITQPSTIEHLTAYSQRHYLDSRYWLTTQQAAIYYETRLCAGHINTNTISGGTTDMIPTNRFNGVSFALDYLQGPHSRQNFTPVMAAMSNSEHRTFLRKYPTPDGTPLNKALYFHGGQWLPLPQNELLLSSFAFDYHNRAADTGDRVVLPTTLFKQRPLFVSRRDEAFENAVSEGLEVKLHNAQEFLSPLKIDPSVEPVDGMNQDPFPPQLRSGLMTLQRQHRYSSMRWIMTSDCGAAGVKPKDGEWPCPALDHIAMPLINAAWVPEWEGRRQLYMLSPRWVKDGVKHGNSRSWVRAFKKWRPYTSAPDPLKLNKKIGAEVREGLSPKKEYMMEVLQRMWFTVEEFEHLALEKVDVRKLPSVQIKGLTIPFRFYNYDQLERVADTRGKNSINNSPVAVEKIMSAVASRVGDDREGEMFVDGTVDGAEEGTPTTSVTSLGNGGTPIISDTAEVINPQSEGETSLGGWGDEDDSPVGDDASFATGGGEMGEEGGGGVPMGSTIGMGEGEEDEDGMELAGMDHQQSLLDYPGMLNSHNNNNAKGVQPTATAEHDNAFGHPPVEGTSSSALPSSLTQHEQTAFTPEFQDEEMEMDDVDMFNSVAGE